MIYRYRNVAMLAIALLSPGMSLVSAGAQPQKQAARPKAQAKRPSAAMAQARAPQQAVPVPPTSDLLVFLTPGTDAQQWARQYGMMIVRQLKSDPDAYVFRATNPPRAKDALRRIGPTAFQSMKPQRHPLAAADANVRFAGAG